MDGNHKEYRSIIKIIHQVIRPKVYLEVGCRHGETLRYLTAEKSKTEFHAIDIKDVSKSLPKNVKFHLGSSNDIAKTWKLPIDMLFIDADHSFEAVMNDFNIYSKFVTHNGIILLHDTFPENKEMTLPNNCGEAWKAAWNIRQYLNDEFEIVTLPIKNGLSIIRKSKTQIDWQVL